MSEAGTFTLILIAAVLLLVIYVNVAAPYIY